MSAKRILIIDDEEAVCWALQRAFERAGHVVAIAASAEAGLDAARRDPPDCIFLDVRLPGMDGLAALAELRRLTHDAPVVVMTAHGNLSTAVRAVEGGAFDYLAKPFDLAQALDVAARALSRPAAAPEGAAFEPSAEDFVGRSHAMQQVFKQIALVSPRDTSVLITGESGTGKELVARAIHRHSAYHNKPFIPVHIAAMNPNLVESELFGHVKGAFTGANADRPGLLALADGGTVFLDELADIPLAVQAKLLRVLEHNEVFPVGGDSPQALRLRVLSATHGDLAREVEQGRFRHDLFFRLHGFRIHLPALRDRGDDVVVLAEHFLGQLDPRALPLSAETVKYLKSRTWPGNVRELRHALEYAAIVANGGVLSPAHFPPSAAHPLSQDLPAQIGALVRRWVGERVAAAAGTEPVNLYDECLAVIEPALVAEVLARTQGNRLAASRWLGLARATVRKLIARHLPGVPTTDADAEG